MSEGREVVGSGRGIGGSGYEGCEGLCKGDCCEGNGARLFPFIAS